METLEQIKTLVDTLTAETTKFYEKKNKSAGTRARKAAQQLKDLMQVLRKEILVDTKENEND